MMLGGARVPEVFPASCACRSNRHETIQIAKIQKAPLRKAVRMVLKGGI